ncbi:MAG: ABC transporter substrate-binding protein [Halobacteriovoraceae bacterium]|jgi:NitT/TauT family transport system substrate-binding protein|nr:ABC transporter substrate-binding protein [Halobacteriovoraceae bacterium]MBT5095068.1 ABC transporter substrate-binding protein [Halobacteriovoraceae bacterium]
MKKLILCLCISLGAFGCFDSQQIERPLLVGTNLWPGYQPLYMAVDRGLLGIGDIHLTEFSSATQVLKALKEGNLDLAGLTLDEAILGAVHQELQVILVMDISNGADAILGGTGEKSLKTLKGKKIGVEKTALGSFFLNRALEKNNLKVSDFKIIHVEQDQHASDFLGHSIDAVVTFEPIKSRLMSKGAKVLFDSSQIPGEVVDVLVARKEVLINNPKKVQKLLGAWFKMLAIIHQRPAEAAAFMAPVLGISNTEVLKTFANIKFPNLKECNALFNGRSQSVLAKTANKLQAVLEGMEQIPKQLNLTDLFNKGPLSTVIPD